ncbi:hypothetical protein LLEC1_07742 [Akanthomyces lecanii]|uniref:Uncharacterized protein n=1 Tax=Cordyceps confragosa TaxID=2714763 RepID=A0A179IFX8_CORDF|nr:hypothetical protein LLEC1_07742 [Akanthomyces lecanii]
MVSFFGLRFGGDKKKGPAKSGDKKSQDNWKGIDQSQLPRGPFYGASQQNEHARPGTSYSTKGPTNWRQTFKGFGANSSMVDLSSPMRKESVSGLRRQPSEANFRNPWMNSSTANLPLPSALGGGGPRVGTPERPSTAGSRAKEWVNPLDVHFCKDSTGDPLSRPNNTDGPAKSPLALHFAVNDDEDVAEPSNPSKDKTSLSKNGTALNNGYPSPPQSVNNADQTLSPSVSDLSMAGKPNGDPSSLPSPATSAPRSSEDRWEAPVIRNVAAKRDTTTFNSPRRCSFTMDVEQQELERLRKQRQTEGFAGSFADFDFGEIITKQASVEQFPEPPSSGLNASPRVEPFPTFREHQLPTSEPHSVLTTSVNTAPRRPKRSPRNSQMDSTAMRSMNNSPELASTNLQFPPPAPVEAPRTAGARPATSYGRIGGVPAAAAGAHPGNDSPTTFDPPPRLGFRARLGSDASSRRKAGPPKPLKTSASQPALVQKGASHSIQHDEPSPKSPILPPALSANAVPSGQDTKRSLDLQSPRSLYTKPTLEGDFPVSKGLPRGRQPPRRPPRSDEAASPDRPDFSLPDWGLVNPSEPRHSAMPPPLMTGGQRRPSTSSAFDISLPSPSFASLELDISSSGESLTEAFEEALGKTALSPGLVGDFFTIDTSSAGSTNTTTRVEAKKAPPRPAPVTLPPSPKKCTESRSPAPTRSEFGNSFI